MNDEQDRAVRLLTEAASAMQRALQNREWYRLNDGYGGGPHADFRDAEHHFRALYRILAVNEPTPGQVL